VMVDLLESLKLYLGSPRCVFVLGIDLSAVLATLGRHWEGRSEDANREYLEKLFQALVPVPLPRPSKVRQTLERQLEAHGFKDAVVCADMMLDILEPNPRKLKNFLNSTCANWALFKASRPEGEEAVDEPAPAEPTPSQRFERRFVLLQYLRTHHSALWRLLERQPWTLRMLTKVLNRGTEQDHPMPEGIDTEDQRILEKTIFRSFAHVLKEDPREAEEAMEARRRLEYHDHIPIETAVELFHSRIDRKRSDENFKRHYRKLFDRGGDLPNTLLYPAVVGR